MALALTGHTMVRKTFFRKPLKMQLTNHSSSALMKSTESYGRLRKRGMVPARA